MSNVCICSAGFAFFRTVMASDDEWLRKIFRSATPLPLKKRILPFEAELVRLANDFCLRHRHEKILDVGAGSAIYEAATLAVDVNPAAMRSRGEGLSVCADAACLPILTESVDAVLCSAALHHFRDPEAALMEMRRCARRSAQLFFLCPIAFP
jgi:SAM-dependent methyltransferase